MPRPIAGPQPFLPHACASVLAAASAPTAMVRTASVPAAILLNLVMMNFLPVLPWGSAPFMTVGRELAERGSSGREGEVSRVCRASEILRRGVADRKSV